MSYDPSRNLAKGNGAFAAAGAVIGSYVGLVETFQWFASLYGQEIPTVVANFICGMIIAGGAMAAKRFQNWRKHGWKL